MCGIAGVWNVDERPVDRDALLRARDVMTSRGPDDAGFVIEGGIGLAHRRLSIIDLSPAGRMPMRSSCGRVWGVFNGEVYNFHELREQLKQCGREFRGSSDSEVFVNAFAEWGPACFHRIDGMFAAAFWSEETKTLTLARDPLGQKPLSYRIDGRGNVVFASVLWSLVELLREEARVDSDSVKAYLQLGFVPAPRTILEGVHKVPPGAYVRITRGSHETHRYWSLSEVAEGDHVQWTANEAQAQLLQLARQAVRKRLVSDVPLGAFLSGGVDSSLVVALMAEVLGSQVQTYTIGFREGAFDESPFAREVADRLGVHNEAVVLSPSDVLENVPKVVDALDEPMADYSMLPTLSVCQLARRHVTVALTGDGADEAFGGYRYYVASKWFESYARVAPLAVRRGLATAARTIPQAGVRRIAERTSASDAAVFFAQSGFYRGATCRAVSRVFNSEVTPATEPIADFIRSFSKLAPTEAGMVYDATRTLSDAWLLKLDRASMLVGLEARSPFLDRQLVEFAFRLPFSLRVRGLSKKYLLRRVLWTYLPRQLVERPKQGFTAPMARWFRGDLRGELERRLSSSQVGKWSVLSPRGVTDVLREHLEGRADHAQLLWALFLLEAWNEGLERRRAAAMGARLQHVAAAAP